MGVELWVVVDGLIRKWMRNKKGCNCLE